MTEIGFSDHSYTFFDESYCINKDDIKNYQDTIRALSLKYKDKIKVLCGIEQDFYSTEPTDNYDYIIGSVHLVRANDGALVPVDESPEKLISGIREHFNGEVQAFVRAYFEQEREMLSTCDFDIIGHLDLVRKFNVRHPYFDESASWYLNELELTAEAAAKSGKIVEVNTGAISRGWLDDAYPSNAFRQMLRSRGVKFVLNSDAHASSALDCAFDRFADEEEYVTLP
jgi:histidinol-phosphatase (PHP family)